MNYSDKRKRYLAAEKYSKFLWTETQSNWMHVTTYAEEIKLELNCSDSPPDENHTIILSIGIMYGTVGHKNDMQQVAGVGSAKILGAV